MKNINLLNDLPKFKRGDKVMVRDSKYPCTITRLYDIGLKIYDARGMDGCYIIGEKVISENDILYKIN